VFAAVRAANRGRLDDEALARALDDCWRIPLDAVAAKHGFTDEMLAVAREAKRELEVKTPMSGYGDLHVLATLPVLRFLVTSGFRRLQDSKIRALQLAPLMVATYVDDIEEPDRKGKEGLFRQILKEHRLEPQEALVVGDSAESEIAAGNRLGIPTVQILRPGVRRTDLATYHVAGLEEIRGLPGVPRPPAG
jgi:FMN phosphatase YigB (HAD superfamily)